MDEIPFPLLLELITQSQLTLRLFTPTGQEATFRGYEPRILTEADWQRGAAGAVCRPQHFQSTIDQRQEIAGWMLTDEQGRSWPGKRFADGPYRITAAGDIIEVALTLEN